MATPNVLVRTHYYEMPVSRKSSSEAKTMPGTRILT
jgi:hypothetical protein